MKKILGLILCTGLLLVGLAAAHGSSPTLEKVQHETAIATAGTSTPEMGRVEFIAKLELALERAAQKAWEDTAAERAKVMDTSDIQQMIAELKANTVSRRQVARLSNAMGRRGSVHRWCGCSGRYDPGNTGYSTEWGRKICEG